MKHFNLSLLPLLLLSCSHNTPVVPLLDEDCHIISFNDCRDSLFVNCIESIDLIPFEMNEYSLYITNPNYLFINDSTTVLIQGSNGVMMCFVNGMNTSARRLVGRGHGEYIEFGNAFVYNGLIGIYDCSSTKTLFYNPAGEFVKSVSWKDRINGEFFQINDQYTVAFNQSGQKGDFVFFYDNTSGKIKKKDCQIDKWLSLAQNASIPFSYTNNGFSFYLDYGYMIYGVDSCFVKQRYFLDFPDKVTNTVIKGKNISDLSIKLTESCSSGQLIGKLIETDRFFYINKTYYNQSGFSILIDKDNNESYIFNRDDGYDDNAPALLRFLTQIIPLNSNSNSIYVCCGYEQFLEIEQSGIAPTDSVMYPLVGQIEKYKELYHFDNDATLFFEIKMIQ